VRKISPPPRFDPRIVQPVASRYTGYATRPTPLHIKLGLIKLFTKAIHEEGEGFDYLRKKLPRVSQAKIKGVIFVDPQVKQLLEDPT
jgi:hypothetical protein